MLRWLAVVTSDTIHLKGLSPPFADRQRERVLTDAEIKAVWNAAVR